MNEKPTYENVTLQKLLPVKIKELGLSRSALVRRMGYSNVSKGLRRLDHYVQTLEPPSEEFADRLCAALLLTPREFDSVLECTYKQLCAEAEKAFRPYLEVLLSIQIRPAFAWQLIHNLCCQAVPAELQEKSYQEEIDAVKALYQKRVADALSESLQKRVAGFVYHRKYNRSLQFNAELEFVKTIVVQPVARGKIPLGNRLANLLSIGC
jgi:hypothetical protein